MISPPVPLAFCITGTSKQSIVAPSFGSDRPYSTIRVAAPSLNVMARPGPGRGQDPKLGKFQQEQPRESPEKALPLWTVVFFCAECRALPPFSRSTNLFDAGLFLAGPGEASEQWNGCNTSRPPGLAKGTVNLTLTAQRQCRSRLRHGRCNVPLAQQNRGMRVRESGTQMSHRTRHGARVKP
jgi:hypothetical protein